MDPDSIRSRIQALARKDKRRNVFGAGAHDYKLNEPLDAKEIESFEGRHQISLPDDYRNFITQVGNGGAGPAYGLFPFGQQDDSCGFRSWEDGDLIGEVGKPFPHEQAWNVDASFWDGEPNPSEGVSEEEEDRLWEQWDEVMEEHYWNPSLVDGAIPICHIGCALRVWLVVNGAQRGYVWEDFRADHGGLQPLTDSAGDQLTFTAWYLKWLDEAERKCRWFV